MRYAISGHSVVVLNLLDRLLSIMFSGIWTSMMVAYWASNFMLLWRDYAAFSISWRSGGIHLDAGFHSQANFETGVQYFQNPPDYHTVETCVEKQFADDGYLQHSGGSFPCTKFICISSRTDTGCCMQFHFLMGGVSGRLLTPYCPFLHSSMVLGCHKCSTIVHRQYEIGPI